MDLTREEAQELFPDDRGDSVDDANVEQWVTIERESFGWTVTMDDEYFIPGSQEEDVVGELSDIGYSDPNIWTLLLDREQSRDVLEVVLNSE